MLTRRFSIWSDLLHLLYPRLCLICQRLLTDQEEMLCLHCFCGLPTTRFQNLTTNPAAHRFTGKVPFQHATSWLYYEKGSAAQQLIHRLKYKGDAPLGVWLGQQAAHELKRQNPLLFESVDLLIPVPLHPKKERKRGYNQSACIAEGISRVVGIPILNHNLFRKNEKESQTRKSVFERWEQTQEQFAIREPASLIGKHVLLIDDVITTGSTLEACAQALSGIENIQISLFSIALA